MAAAAHTRLRRTWGKKRQPPHQLSEQNTSTSPAGFWKEAAKARGFQIICQGSELPSVHLTWTSLSPEMRQGKTAAQCHQLLSARVSVSSAGPVTAASELPPAAGTAQAAKALQPVHPLPCSQESNTVLPPTLHSPTSSELNLINLHFVDEASATLKRALTELQLQGPAEPHGANGSKAWGRCGVRAGCCSCPSHRPTQPKPRMGCSRPGTSVQTSGSNKRVQKQGVFYTQNFPCDVFPQLRFVEAAQIKLCANQHKEKHVP